MSKRLRVVFALLLAARNFDSAVATCRGEFSFPVGPYPSAGDRASHLALLAAAKADDVAGVERQLARRPDVVDMLNWDDDSGPEGDDLTALMHAAMRGHVRVVKLLLAAPEIDGNRKDCNGNTALLWAMEAPNKDRIATVSALVAAQGIDINIRNRGYKSALLKAVLNDDNELVRLLSTAPGIDINAGVESFGGYDFSGKFSGTALMWAIRKDHTNVVRTLLAAPGIDVNKQERRFDGCTFVCGKGAAIHYAIISGHDNIVTMLLNAPGIDVNQMSTLNKGLDTRIYPGTPLGMAVVKDRMSLVRMLVHTRHVNVSAAIWRRGPMSARHMGTWSTALTAAVRLGRVEMVKVLLAAPGMTLNDGLFQELRDFGSRHGRTQSDWFTALAIKKDIVSQLTAYQFAKALSQASQSQRTCHQSTGTLMIASLPTITYSYYQLLFN